MKVHHELDARLCRSIDDSLAFLGRSGKGLLDEDVLARFGGGDGDVSVSEVGRGDGHRLDELVGQKGAIVCVVLGPVRLGDRLGFLFREVTNAGQGDTLVGSVSPDVHLTPESGSDNSESDFFHVQLL